MVGSYWRYKVDQEVVDNYLIWETSVLVVFVHIMTEHHRYHEVLDDAHLLVHGLALVTHKIQR